MNTSPSFPHGTDYTCVCVCVCVPGHQLMMMNCRAVIPPSLPSETPHSQHGPVIDITTSAPSSIYQSTYWIAPTSRTGALGDGAAASHSLEMCPVALLIRPVFCCLPSLVRFNETSLHTSSSSLSVPPRTVAAIVSILNLLHHVAGRAMIEKKTRKQRNQSVHPHRRSSKGPRVAVVVVVLLGAD